MDSDPLRRHSPPPANPELPGRLRSPEREPCQRSPPQKESQMPTMPAVVHTEMKKGAVEQRDMPVPEIGENEILMRVRGVGVCGSDVHQYHATQSWSVRVPVILGHEFCGEVAA